MDGWTYLQGRNRDRDVENSLMDTAAGEQVGLGERHWGMCILGRRTEPVGGCRIAQGFNSALWQLRGVGWRRGRGFKSEGARVYLWRSTLLVAEPTQHHKAIILQLKSKKERKKTGTYIKWNISHWKEWNNATCSNIGEPGDYHPEWSNQAKTSITWYCLYAGS